MDDARKHIDFSMRVKRARNPLRATRQLPRANNRLIDANELYAVAVADLELSMQMMRASIEDVDYAEMVKALTGTAQRLLEIASEIAALAEKIDERHQEIVQDAFFAGLEGRELLESPLRPIPQRRFLLRSNLSEIIRTLFKRRQRSKAATPEDAPRKVSRGRAPPLLSDCTL
jgi:hypothetical protein